jgi:hypothetical protein
MAGTIVAEDCGMNINMGNVDRFARAIVGTFVLALAFVGPKSAWGLLGLVPLLTGLFGFCPLYRVLGVETRSPLRS